MPTRPQFVVGWIILGLGWLAIIIFGLVVLPGEPAAVQNWSVAGFLIGSATVWTVGQVWKRTTGTRNSASPRRPEG